MSIFAGAYCLNRASKVPDDLRADISRYLRATNARDGERTCVSHPGFYLETWDSGAFGEPSWQTNENGESIKIAGDPLLCENGTRLSRTEQTRRISAALAMRESDTLDDCRGSFAVAAFDARAHVLHLCTDAIGLRSVYYLVQDGLLIFATALRLIEAIPMIRRTLSSEGMAELSVLSFPLADRTPYAEIKVLRESEILLAADGQLKLERYHDWSVTEEIPGDDINQAAERLYSVFREAVDIRAGQDKNVYSFLSGGMDSRSIVATLLKGNRHVEALNFSATASQDQYYAQRYVEQISQHCTLHCLPGGIYPNFSFLAKAAKTDIESSRQITVDRPQFIWSGDGGSVGLGHVYMNEHMLDLTERNGIEAAAHYFLEFNRIALPSGILSGTAREELPDRFLAAVVSEMNRYPHPDLGRRIYLFLLFNDQRRHLFKHFETIDQHGLELLTPFYDAKFLKAITAIPARWGILHRFYCIWFEHLPAQARATPWQTYPGHVTCPVLTEATGSYQWTARTAEQRDAFAERGKLALQMVKTCRVANRQGTFSTARVWLAAGLHALGVRDCKHLLSILQIYARHAQLVS